VRAIDMEAHAEALAQAQRLDADRTSQLTGRLDASAGALVELPYPVPALRARVLAAADPGAGAALRGVVAPGLLGRAPWLAAALLALAGAVGHALARVPPSRACPGCGTRMCPRCGTGDPQRGVCAACARRRVAARHESPWERGERAGSTAARLAGAAARLLPGLADAEPRPGAALAALAALAVGAALAAGRAGVVADPASVGGAGPLALAGAAAALLAAGLGLALWSRAGGR
jgi:hypothetical protein